MLLDIAADGSGGIVGTLKGSESAIVGIQGGEGRREGGGIRKGEIKSERLGAAATVAGTLKTTEGGSRTEETRR